MAFAKVPALYLLPNSALAEPAVQKLDAWILYSLSAGIFPLVRIKNASPTERGMTVGEVRLAVFSAHHVLEDFLKKNRLGLKRSLIESGERLLAAIISLEGDLGDVSKWGERFGSIKLSSLQPELTTFQNVLKSEVGDLPIYLVGRKGAFDTDKLINEGDALFPSDLATKVPAAISDIQQGARCIAFELPTAAAYHLHRANETVLRAYFGVVTNGVTPPKNPSMGNYLFEMDKLGVGDKEIKDSLRNLVKNHRNPVIHPGHSLSNVNEAIELLNAILAVVAPMLKVIT